MIGLSGVLSATSLSQVHDATDLRFKNRKQFKTPEALIVYEQRMLDEATLLRICQREYPDVELLTPQNAYIPRDLVEEFRGRDCVPIRYDTATDTIYVGVIPECAKYIPSVRHIKVKVVNVPIYYYVNLYTKQYGRPDFLYAIPAKDKFDMIVQEALALKASDITITSVLEGPRVYYNVRKNKVHSRRTLVREDVDDIAKILASQAQSPVTDSGVIPKYLSVRLDMHHRGRVVINRTYYGYTITIRVLSDDVLTQELEELNIAPSTCDFIRKETLSRDKGLRLFIGETMSGKNTTILSALRELVRTDKYKIVSIEQPVEILVEGIEQINTETEEEYHANASSLLRQNPDIVYLTEITESTATDILTAANTGKVVFSTIHANSISDVMSRLMDITSMSSDRLLLSLHSCVYQELVRDEENDRVYPVNRCLLFTDELKMKLWGKSVGEVKTILMEEESKWH